MPTTKAEGGGTSGTEFTSSSPILEPRISIITVWVDKGAGQWSDRDLVKDIELTWNTGFKSSITGNHTGKPYAFQFANDEKISRMTIYTGDRVDQITFQTTMNREFKAGGSHGTAHGQDTGKSILLGFHGTWSSTDKELITLGSKFKD
ncbi:hypothetical protein GQ44DRAFT_667452 [Phaeosphaeriaceae sp. PMI808]|nr:hypothetical protein GQ44DRAFT_667452 [Phaeosphaeriaceae sp. PMI808]